MNRPLTLLTLLFLAVLTGCSAESPAPVEGSLSTAPPVAAEPVVAASPEDIDPDDPSILRRPFTSDEIREEWVAGLTILMQTQTGQGGALERWKVTSVDEEGADIEFSQVDRDGKPSGEPRLARSTWEDLRNHATFPAASATREEMTLKTALGELDGWFYTVRDDVAGTQTEYFFAKTYPGAPVQMRVMSNGEPIMELAQIERQRPE